MSEGVLKGLKGRSILIGTRAAILVLVPATLALTSGVVDAWWWHTAQANGRMLAGTMNREVVVEVKHELIRPPRY